MGRETKFGLLVGLIFIVLFGVILSGRAGSSVQEHAALPTGESDGHRMMAKTIDRTVQPFEGTALEVPKGTARTVAETPQPPEESLPAPEGLASETPQARPDVVGSVAFGPTIIETPMSRETGPRPVREDVGFRTPVTPAPPPAAARTVHTVRPGESLTTIARQYFGKEGDKMWRQILDANKGAIRDANRLAVGQKLVIPTPPAAPRKEAPAPVPVPAESPRKDLPREPVRDSYFAGGAGKVAPTAPSSNPLEELRKMTVPVSDKVRPPAPVVRDATRDVTARDVGRMLGTQSDLVEMPARPVATYTIQPGDNFTKIAEKLYGDGRLGRLLYLKNQHLVPDERKMKIGQRILLLEGVSSTPVSEVAVAKR